MEGPRPGFVSPGERLHQLSQFAHQLLAALSQAGGTDWDQLQSEDDGMLRIIIRRKRRIDRINIRNKYTK